MIHFIGFRGEEYWSAVRIWGKPDFYHRYWDKRVRRGGEYEEGDVLIFATGTDADLPREQAFNDSAVF